MGEVHAQLRQVNSTEARLWEFKRQVDEQCRTLCSEIEEKTRVAVSSKYREMTNAHEDYLKKTTQQFQRVDALIEERISEQHEIINQAIAEMNIRLEAAEESMHQDATRATSEQIMARRNSSPSGPNDDSDVRRHVERLLHTCDMLRDDAHGEGGISSRLEEHDVRLLALRSKVDTQEARHREETEQRFFKISQQLVGHDNLLKAFDSRVHDLNSWVTCIEKQLSERRAATTDDRSFAAENTEGHNAFEVQLAYAALEVPEHKVRDAIEEPETIFGAETTDWNQATSKALLDAYASVDAASLETASVPTPSPPGAPTVRVPSGHGFPGPVYEKEYHQTF